ncbi:MAG: DUF2007 domain-containing protein [Planctomycetes bacterium]|nr:DUF2007 domain-containing protein [Planctomycetota bacterium]
MREDEKLVAIQEFEYSSDAELAKQILKDAGIEAVVFGEDLITMLPHINSIHVELRVFESDVEKSKQILAEQEPLEEDEESDAEEA